MFRKIVLSAVVIGTLAAGASPAFAAKGGKNAPAPTASIQLAAGSDARLGGNVWFDSTWPSTVKNPRVAVMCYDGTGTMVYAETGTYDHVFLLGGASSPWLQNPGPAHCDAELYEVVWHGNNMQQWTTYATTSFDAAG